MRKRHFISVLFIFLLILNFPLFAEYEDLNINIKVSLFKGIWDESQKGIEKELVMTSSSHPEMAHLKDKALGPEQEYISALMETLVETMDLQGIEELGLLKDYYWHVTETSFKATIWRREAAFQFILIPTRLSPQKFSLITIVEKTKEDAVAQYREAQEKKSKAELSKWDELDASFTASIKGHTERILEREIILQVGEPVLVGIPYKDMAYFISILIPGLENPNPIHKVTPVYPEELKEEGIGGEVQLKVKVNAWGEVWKVEVTESLHPYLDHAAVMALKKWKFEPFFLGGRPVPAEFIYKVNFNPEAEAQRDAGTEEAPDRQESYSQELVTILHECAKYCEKLNKATLDFICKEKIHDIYYGPDPKRSGYTISFGKSTLSINGRIAAGPPRMFKPFWGVWKIERNQYLSDYLLVKKGQEIREKRVLLKENSRQVPAQKEYLKNPRFSGLKPFLAPGKVLGQDRQELFSFSILKDRENLYEIEAVPISRYAGGIEYARIWVDRQGFQILRMEIKGIPLEGYNEVLEETTEHNVKPEFITTYSYKMEKEGLLFPYKVNILVRYPMFLNETTFYKTKIKTNINYDDYQFFSVKTESDFDKK
ncbi:MAG: energy transducer TonB [Candidatus Aminicenantes bacterium]|nr:energy transducer TonB [Candidatus Aminicenantes bacterium]